MALDVVITGSTGMVGEGVLHECLEDPGVASVLVINRTTIDLKHPKLSELIVSDFSDFSHVKDKLKGYSAAFLCMGITSFRVSEAKYSRITHDMTLALAKPLAELNPDMTLCYVSGLGTDSTESSRNMWTRIKGRTENALLQLPVKQTFMFRPGLIQPTPGLRNAYTFYKWINPLIPTLKKIFPKYISTLKEIGVAMIKVSLSGYKSSIIEVSDIDELAKR